MEREHILWKERQPPSHHLSHYPLEREHILWKENTFSGPPLAPSVPLCTPPPSPHQHTVSLYSPPHPRIPHPRLQALQWHQPTLLRRMRRRPPPAVHTQTHTDTYRHIQTDTNTYRHQDASSSTNSEHAQTHTETHRHIQTHTDTLPPSRAHTDTYRAHTDTHKAHTDTHRHIVTIQIPSDTGQRRDAGRRVGG